MSKIVKNKKIMVVISFVLPLIILCFSMIKNKIYPFGDMSILQWDQKLQYKDYYTYAWRVLHGEGSISYSFSKSLGGRMIGLDAFYISNISNILLIFIKQSQIPQFMSFMLILKVSLSGLTSYIFIRKRFELSCLWSLILSTSYALMEYNVVYCRNIMWLDGAVMLPLVCLGVYYCIYDKNKLLLPVSVCIAIVNNWYTGYMVCFMAVIYSIYELASCNDKLSMKQYIKKFINYCLFLLLGVCGSAFILLPSCLSLVGGKAKFTILTLHQNMPFMKVFSGFLIEADYNKPSAAILYCGGVVLLVVVYSLWSKGFDLRKKLINSAFLIFMLCGFVFQDLEFVWTALVKSSSYYFRFAFVFAFAMIVVAGDYLNYRDKCDDKTDIRTMIKALLSIAVVIMLLNNNYWINDSCRAYIYLCLIVVYGILILKDYKETRSLLLIVLLLSLELFKNCNLSMMLFENKVSGYTDYFNKMDGIVKELDDRTDGFYRMEKNNFSYFSGTYSQDAPTCESFTFGYSGLENYTSAYDIRVDDFLDNVGYSGYPLIEFFPSECYWNDSQPLMETILGTKYVFYNRDLYGYKKYELIGSQLPEGINCYENQRALPIAFGITNDVKEFEYGDDPFANQNRIVSSMLGQNVQVYEKQNYIRTYDDNSDEMDESIQITATESGPLYIFVNGFDIHKFDADKKCSLYLNGQMLQKCCSRLNVNTISLGNYQKGDTLTVTIKHDSGDEGKHVIYVYRINEQTYDKVYEQLSSTTFDSIDVKDGYISANSSFDKDTRVFLSVPFDPGWKCYIDGDKVSIDEFAETFCTIDVPKGEHKITMKYTTPGSGIGNTISVFALITLIGINLYPVIKNKRKIK